MAGSTPMLRPSRGGPQGPVVVEMLHDGGRPLGGACSAGPVKRVVNARRIVYNQRNRIATLTAEADSG
jgi:hypothetical protein